LERQRASPCSLSAPNAQRNGDSIEATFDQLVTLDGNKSPQHTLRATLVRTGSSWKIQKLETLK
jgi:hypothetical protein